MTWALGKPLKGTSTFKAGEVMLTILNRKKFRESGINIDNIDHYLENTHRLKQSGVKIWPDPNDIVHGGAKASYQTLLRAVSECTLAHIPIVSKQHGIELLRNRLSDPGHHWVIKRNFSCEGNDVYFPGDVAEFIAAWDQVAALSQVGRYLCEFFAMPYVEELKTKGEAKVIFAGGRVVGMFSMTPPLWLQEIRSVTPLDLLE